MGRPDRARLRILSAALVATTGAVVPAFLTGALAVQIQRDLGANPAALGFAVSAFFYAAGLTSVPLGRTADRLGWARSLRHASAISVASLVSVALLAHSWTTLTVVLVIGGIGHGLTMPASNLALAREFGPARRGLLFGIKQSASPLATSMGGAAVPLLALTVGWRWAFAAVAAVPLIGAGMVPPTASTVAGGTPPEAGRDRTWAMVRLAVAGGCGAAVVTALSSFLVVSAVSAGMREDAAGRLLVLGSVVSMVARVVVGFVVDRRHIAAFGMAAALLLVGAAGLLLLAAGSGAVVVVGTIVAFAAGAGWPGLFHLSVVNHNSDRPGSASGIIQTGLTVGAASGPLAFGLVVAGAGYGAAWAASAVAAAAAGLAILTSGRRLGSLEVVER